MIYSDYQFRAPPEKIVRVITDTDAKNEADDHFEVVQALLSLRMEPVPRKSAFRTGETWVLGDNPAVGLILYEHRFLYDRVSAPTISQDMTYMHSGRNPSIRG